jgi:hypothetical protein
MALHRKAVAVVSLAVVLALPACRNRTTHPADTVTNPNPEDLTTAKQAVERAQMSLREVSDVMVKQAAAQNSIGKNDPAISDAIREYEALPADQRVNYIVTNDRFRDIFSQPWQEATENIPATPELRRKTGFDFPGVQKVQPENFDLAMRKADVFAQQVKLTNALFNDADAKVISAVDAWQKMTPEQKRAFVATPENSAYYWNYVYLTYRLQLLRYYYLYTRECYWGYRTPKEITAFDPKQFDLPTQELRK